MALEDLTGVKYIDSLVSTNPVGSTDPISDIDGHIQGIKNVLKTSFPGVTGAVTSTHTELNIMDAGATVTTPVVAGGDAFVMDDLDVGMVQVDIDNVDTYLAQTTKTLTNKTIDSPVIATLFTATGLVKAADLSTSQFGGDYVMLQDQQTSGTAGGGTASAGAWTKRTLNTEVIDTGNVCSLSSSVFVLSAGTYRIKAKACAYQIRSYAMRLQNTTAAATVLQGLNGSSDDTATDNNVLYAEVSGYFTIAASQNLELQMYGEIANATNGWGLAVADSSGEIYAQVELWKVK